MAIDFCTIKNNLPSRSDCHRCKFLNSPESYQAKPPEPMPKCVRVTEGELTLQGDLKINKEGNAPKSRRL